MSYEDRFCLIPEAGLNITPSGHITPCCVAPEYTLGHITKDSLSSVFYGKTYSEFRQAHRQGNLPSICVEKCIKKKTDFVHVQGRNQIVKNSEDKKLKEPNKEKLIMLDIGLGNVCNLTCVFCNETWSSSWAKFKNKTSDIFHFDLDTTVGIAQDIKDVIFINFKGGEPLNIPHLDAFLEQLYESTKERECMVALLSNGTETNDRLNKSLFKFNVSLGISTEATGELYQYLRGGKYTWDNVLTNIDSFVELGCKNIHIASLISLYNYTTWAKDMLEIQRQIKSKVDGFSLSAQLCTHPQEQSLFLLNKEQRQRLVDSIKDACDQGLELNNVESMFRSILTDVSVETTREKVLEQIEYNNKLRNMNLFSIIEDFTEHLVL